MEQTSKNIGKQTEAHTDLSEEKHRKIATIHQDEDEAGMEHGFGLHNKINPDPNIE